MFCPRCSEEQVSDEIRFCPRCGFLLADVAEALRNGGRIDRRVVQSAREIKADAVKGVAFLALSAIFILLSLIFGTPEPSLFVQFNLLVGVLVFLFGLLFLGYAFWLKPRRLGKELEAAVFESLESRPAGESASPRLEKADLSPAVGAVSSSPLETSELVGVPGVTEDTTKKLRLVRE